MAKLTKIQQAQFDSLTAQVAELTTTKGILMSEVESLKSELTTARAHAEHYEVEASKLQQDLDTAKAQIVKQGQVIAAQPKSAPPRNPQPAPKPLPSPAVVECQAVVQITDADKTIWAKFQRLSREERMTIINWARPQFGHVGINNIIAVRAAWHEFNNPESCADEANLADIA